MNRRYLYSLLQEDALRRGKIAMLSGPRQVGKTTLARSYLDNRSGHYFTWDDDEFKRLWAKNPKQLIQLSQDKDLLILDEIHKHRLWKNKLKALYDLYGNKRQFLALGSARLDYYRKSGDSLQGRYLPYRLHPFSMCESDSIKPPPQNNWFEHANKGIDLDIADMLHLSAFPEALLTMNEQEAQRWSRLYKERLIYEDLRDLEAVRDIQQINVLASLIPEKVASKFSYQSLSEDVAASVDSIKRWCAMLEACYYVYSIAPFSKNIKQAIKKEPKVYLYDYTHIDNAGSRWENYIANHLLKNVHAWTDAAYGHFELFYLRDKQKRECDFFITKDHKPYLLLEVKSNQQNISKGLIYFQKQLQAPFCFQLVKLKKHERSKSLSNPDIEVIAAERFLQALN